MIFTCSASGGQCLLIILIINNNNYQETLTCAGAAGKNSSFFAKLRIVLINTRHPQHMHFGQATVNGKVWVNGGADQVFRFYKDTYFLIPESGYSWVRGPDLPGYIAHHTAVTISPTQVAIFGGHNSNVWIYDDETGTFEVKRPFWLDLFVVAGKITDFDEIGKEVVLAVVKSRHAYVYDWRIDEWFKLGPSWNIPSNKQFNGLIFQKDKK